MCSRGRSPRRFLWLIAVLAAAFAWVGCRTFPATQVLVFFHAEPTLAASATRLEVRVFDAMGTEPVFESVEPLAGAVGALARVPLVPASGDASRRFRIEGSLLDDAGAVVSTVSAASGYVEHELRELHLWFDDDCAGVDCGVGRTCQSGVCLGECFEAEPAGSLRSSARCGECELCTGGTCTPRPAGSACGCEGDTCSGTECRNAAPVRAAFAGASHTCAEVADRGVFCWGSDRTGMITTSDTPTPALVIGSTGYTGAAGWDHTCVLSFTGVRTCFGWNEAGQIGNGSTESVAVEPTDFADPPFSSIAAGRFSTCGLHREDAGIDCWGGNSRGEVASPVGGTVDSPTRRSPMGQRFEQVALGGFHGCAIRSDGRVFCWGYNASGESGVGSFTEYVLEPTEAACIDGVCRDDWETLGLGDFHSCGIRAGGELYCWGGNLNSQLGFAPPNPAEPNENRPPRDPLPGGPYRAVAGGTSHTCALTMDGRLRCWGRNDHGQVGVGSLDNVPTPADVADTERFRLLALGAEHSCAVREDESLWCWGWNTEGQLGLGPDVTDEEVPAPRRVCFPPP